jgi:DNA-binding NarL/FixJ family response regulator
MHSAFTDASPAIRVALFDAHPVVTEGLRADLHRRSGGQIRVSRVAQTIDHLLAPDKHDSIVDVVVVEPAHLPEGWQDLEHVLANHRPVIVFTADHRPIPLLRALDLGIAGAILKSDPLEHVENAVHHVAGDRSLPYVSPGATAATRASHAQVQLSSRQVDILDAMSAGLPYRLIAKELAISVASVREYLRRAAAAYRQQGIEAGNSHGLITSARRDGNLACTEFRP